ncbi:AraC family transcriptional regulator [Sinomicrobium oceani]|uniref:AraC family transcriptional regulator n=1 Tax=Sinomicrobium oceani TaxID=1150368 RepID=UPI002DD43070|nr:helix-turn-helix domain-containing protein [Sinomicrobium oceani]
MYYQEFLPLRPLQHYIRYFWVLEDFADHSRKKSFRIIPDGIPALIFQEEPFLFCDHQGTALPQLYIYGQSSRYTDYNIKGSYRVIGSYLQPTALKTIFNIDAFEWNNQNIPLEDIVSEEILEQLLNVTSISEKLGIISNFILKHAEKIKTDHTKAEFASGLIQEGKALGDIQLAMNLSERSLERLIKQYVGMSPKMFSRVMRFQSGLNAMRKSEFKNFTTLTYDKGYSDQSHFIREFKEFTGTNPKRFLRNVNEKLLNFPEWDI